MQFREGTPFLVVLEMHAASLWLPATVLVIAVASFALLHRRCSKLRWQWRFALGFAVIGLALPLMWLGFLWRFLVLLEDPSYRAYVECDPCF